MSRVARSCGTGLVALMLMVALALGGCGPSSKGSTAFQSAWSDIINHGPSVPRTWFAPLGADPVENDELAEARLQHLAAAAAKLGEAVDEILMERGGRGQDRERLIDMGFLCVAYWDLYLACKRVSERGWTGSVSWLPPPDDPYDTTSALEWSLVGKLRSGNLEQYEIRVEDFGVPNLLMQFANELNSEGQLIVPDGSQPASSTNSNKNTERTD